MKLVQTVGIYEPGPIQGIVKRRATPLYNLWHGMLRRCYDGKSLARRPTYDGCEVDPAFYSFQAFAKWATSQIGYGLPFAQLDKDIIKKGNRIYGPDLCCFVPREINLLFMGNAKRGNYPIGVSKVSNGYSAYTTCRRKVESLGVHKTPELAFAAYKRRKEEIIRLITNVHKDVLSPTAYAALMAYQIEITD